MKLSYLDKQTNTQQDKFVAGEWQELVTFQPCIKPKYERWVFGGYASGGRIVQYGKDSLLVSVGDHEIDGKTQEAFAQDMQKGYGKIWKINKRNGEGEIFASGVRNAQGLFIDLSGKIWETEHGPRGGDELNLIKQGLDYGWPVQTYGIYYGNEPWYPNKIQGSHKLFTKPVYAWLPSIGVSNLTQNNKNRFPLWSNDLIVSSLQNEALYRLRMGEDRVIYQEKINIGSRIRDILTLPDGRLALLTTRADSAILIIDRVRNIFEKDKTVAAELAAQSAKVKIVPEQLKVQFARGKEQYDKLCSACHRVNGVTMQAPFLNGLFARKIGSVADFTYSQTLHSMRNKRWNRERLRNLLRKNNKFKETNMPKISISEEQFKKLSIYIEYI
jgi:cytochrome c2